MAIKRDSKGRFSGGGGGGGGTSQRTEALKGINRSKTGLRERAASTNKALTKGAPGMASLRSSAAKELSGANTRIKSLRSDIKGSAKRAGAPVGGKSRKLRTKSPVMDTVRQQTPKGAAKAVAKRGGNALQQRAAANSAATRDMRRSSFGRATARSMMRAAFG